MAYQPIQMPGRPAMFDAMDQVAQSLGQVADDKHRARIEAEAKKRQDQQDFQATLLQAKKLMDAGDMQGAAALMAPYQAQLQQQGGAPPPAGKVPQQPGPSAGGSPLPDGMEFRPGHTDADFDMEHGQAPQQLPGPPSAADRAQILSQMAPPGETLPPENPIMAARQAQQGQNQDRARQVLSFRAPGGQQMTIDPEAARASQLEQKGARLDAAFSTIKDPEVLQMYQVIRPVLMSSAGDVDPTDVFKYIQSNIANKRAEAAAATKQAHDDAVLGQRETLTDRRLEQSDKNNQRMVAAIMGAANTRNNTAEGNAATSVAGRFDSEFNRWQQQQGWGTIRTANRSLQSAMANATSGNPLAEHDAQIQLARVFRGTTPTEGEMHLLYNNLAGKLGNALPAFMEKMNRGGLSPAETQILSESIDIAKQEQQEQVQHIIESARDTFGPGSGHENMAGNVNAKVRGLFAGVGVKAPSVFEGQGGQALPTVTLGKGNPKIDPEAQHPAVAARAAQKQKRAEALPGGKPAALDDAAAVAMAKQRLARNPDDQVAKRVLQMHGMAP